MSLSVLGQRVAYRLRQFRSVFVPPVDRALLEEALRLLPRRWRVPVRRLRPSEQAHVLRLYRAIAAATDLEDQDRRDLLVLSLVRDVGKTVTRPSLLTRIVMTVLPIPKNAHPALGARIMHRLGASAQLCRRIRRHHRDPGDDRLLALFQRYDDSL